MLKSLSVIAAAAVLALVAPGAALGKPLPPPSTPMTTGLDVAWPQCGTSLPRNPAFAIVGVNGGLANDSNPCFLTQLGWAQQSTGLTGQPKAALYVNTANPGLAASWWPQSNTTKQGTPLLVNPYGTCTHRDDAACAYVYGYSMAQSDASIRNVASPGRYLWWLDVETVNSWSTFDLGANAASLEGMTAYLTGIGARVGIYSTSYQWRVIVGRPSSTSNLNGLQSWLAGASSESNARSRCASAPLTPGGRVSLVQYVSRGLDYNVSCL